MHETSFPNILHHGHGKPIKDDQLFTNPFLLRIIVDVPKIFLPQRLNGSADNLMIVEQRDWDYWASKPFSQCHQCQSSALVFLFLVLIVIYNHAYSTS